ncbi:MAG TPA: hypothetical protein VFK02_21590 [Kofleriaceae bacterium]|nr:hypothetical protein [Kofleriaceae bacterium]
MIAGILAGVVALGHDSDARLVRLRATLALGAGFQLVIVEVEPGPIRAEVIRRVQSWAGHASIGALTVVTLDPARALLPQLEATAGALVVGLEPTDPGAVPARDWVAELNWSRDGLPGIVRGPLVLVVSQRTHRELFERAPDLYSWRRYTAHVTVEAPELARPLVSRRDPYWIEQLEVVTAIVGRAEPRAWSLYRFLMIDLLLSLGEHDRALAALDGFTGRWTRPATGHSGERDVDAVPRGHAGLLTIRFLFARPECVDALPLLEQPDQQARLWLCAGRDRARTQW